jgi:hypothetical protein
VRLQTAEIHHQFGRILERTGKASDTAGQFRQLTASLDEIKKEQGAERELERADLKRMYSEAT